MMSKVGVDQQQSGVNPAWHALRSYTPDRRRVRFLLLFCALLATALAGWVSHRATYNSVLDRKMTETRSALGLIAQGISGEVAKFEILAEVMAGDPIVLTYFRSPGDVTGVNARLVDIREISGALEVYLIGTDGTTLAASNWNSIDSFVGKNFAFRPYFQDALAGGFGRFFALGTTSLQRGYFFAAPIRIDDRIVGVSVVKMDIERLEEVWRLDERQVVVVDNADSGAGVVFMSTNPDWRYRTIGTLSDARRRQIRKTRQYPADALSRLPLTEIEPLGADMKVVSVALPTDEGSSDTLLAQLAMRPLGWSIVVLSKLNQVERAAWLAALTGAAIATGLFALLWIAYERRMRALGVARMQVEHRMNLERLVEARTLELSSANDDLRAMQKIVAVNSKFAAIGKLSGGLSHEISQPLTAIDTQLFNVRQALDQDRLDEAVGGLGKIDALSQRLSAIVQKLKSLARGSGIALDPIPLHGAVRNVLRDMAPKLKGVLVVVEDGNGDEVFVNAEKTLLEQVLVNIVANALDAMAGGVDDVDRTLTFRIETDGERAHLSVSDTGSGLAIGQEMEIFEPFETSKSGGGGLGLGLTIAQDAVTRFGGQISAENNEPGPGATIRISLPLSREKNNVMLGAA